MIIQKKSPKIFSNSEDFRRLLVQNNSKMNHEKFEEATNIVGYMVIM